MAKYLNTKPGSVEEVVSNMSKNIRQDSAYQDMFKKELEKAGKGIGAMSPKEKKDFFNKIDAMYKAPNEKPEQKEELNKDDKKVVTKVKDMLKGASAKHAAQAKMLDKAMKNEGLDDKDTKAVKDVVKGLKGAVAAHGQQVKKLDKALKSENVSQVQTKPDGKGNFNLMFRGKEIGYYHREGGRYVVYHSKEDGEYSESDEVSTESQAKKLAYDNMNEADAKGNEINKGKLDRVKNDGEKKLVDPKPSLKAVAKTVKEMMKRKKDDVAPVADTEKEKEKKTTLVGSKKTPVDTKPEVEYKN